MCRYSAHAGVSCAVWTRHQLAAAAAVVQLTAAASHSSPHTRPSACPRPELWASTCLAQSVLSGEKCHHMCLQSSLAGWWWWCTPSRAHHATDTGRGAVAAAQPAPAAADRLPQRDSAAHRRVDRLLPQLQRAGPGSRVTLATLPSVAQLRRHSVSINPWRL